MDFNFTCEKLSFLMLKEYKSDNLFVEILCHDGIVVCRKDFIYDYTKEL